MKTDTVGSQSPFLHTLRAQPRPKRLYRFGLLSLLMLVAQLSWAAGSEPLDFKEVYDLLRTNLAGLSDAELNQAAARGLITALQPKVTLVTKEGETANNPTNAASVLQTTFFDGGYAYIRLGTIKAGTDQEFSAAYKSLASSNRIKGLVLDLRFAEGQDYNAAAAVADWFYSTEQPLIDFGQGVKRSTPKNNGFNRPLAILLNRKTAAAAEALAAMLRQGELGLTIGSSTAGQAAISKEFTLKTGQCVRVAMTPIKVGKGEPLPLTGLKPDISVDVPPQDELVYLEDAYKDLAKTRAAKSTSGATNQVSSTTRPRHRINEAELVRMLREGETFDMENNATARGFDPARPVVQDPVLVRALDLLKGLSVLRQARTL